MQTLYVPKYGITYRVNPKNPCELLWSKKPFGPMTAWQHAYTFNKPIRALDTDDQTGQGVVVLNDSTTYVGSGVRVWGKKFYTAGSRIYSLYAIGESMINTPTLTKLIGQCYYRRIADIVRSKINKAFKGISADLEQTRDGSYNIYVRGTEQDLYDALLSNEFDEIAKDINYLEKDYKPKKIPYTKEEIENAANTYIDDCWKDDAGSDAVAMRDFIRYGEYVQAVKYLSKAGYLKPIQESSPINNRLRIKVHEKWDASSDKHTRNEYRTEMQRIVNPLSKGFFHDTDWSAVWKIRDALKDAFPKVKFELGAKDGGYAGNTKVYNLVATTPEGYELNGRIKCFAAGTKENPFDRYDMTIEIY